MNIEDERAALLRGILEQPDDDTVRLVFADWLEEKGGEPERAALIRVQVELARRGHWPDAKEEIRRRVLTGQISDTAAAILLATAETCPDPLQQRERELWQLACNRQWFDVGMPPGSPAWASSTPGQIVWYHPNRECALVVQRGFVAEVKCEAAGWIICADSIIAKQPVTRAKWATLPTAHVPDFNALRDWKKPLEWGGDLCDSVCAEWPRIAFKFPHEDSWRKPLASEGKATP
jgi:uncharacterized protein (TIGR02996 family)